MVYKLLNRNSYKCYTHISAIEGNINPKSLKRP